MFNFFRDKTPEEIAGLTLKKRIKYWNVRRRYDALERIYEQCVKSGVMKPDDLFNNPTHFNLVEGRGLVNSIDTPIICLLILNRSKMVREKSQPEELVDAVSCFLYCWSVALIPRNEWEALEKQEMVSEIFKARWLEAGTAWRNWEDSDFDIEKAVM